ncbi:unnamed protein product, partial [Meganyctiphanes norvegica]
MADSQYQGRIRYDNIFQSSMTEFGHANHKGLRVIVRGDHRLRNLMTGDENISQLAPLLKICDCQSKYMRSVIHTFVNKNQLKNHFKNPRISLTQCQLTLRMYDMNKLIPKVGSEVAGMEGILRKGHLIQVGTLIWRTRIMSSEFSRSLDDDLQSELSGQFKYLMRGLVAGGRDEDPTKDASRARKDAQDLYDAGVGTNNGTDEAEFIRIMNLRSYPQLQETFEAYENIAQEPIENAINKEFKGDMAKGLLAIIQRVKDPLGFYCERLHQSMAGAGTDDKTLIRILVCRSEVDLHNILLRYKEMYKKELIDDIKDDTNGDYGKLLVAICKPRT